MDEGSRVYALEDPAVTGVAHPPHRAETRRPNDGSALIRVFRAADADAVNRIAVQAFCEHSPMYADWPGLRERLSRMADNSRDADILVAEIAGVLAGAVLYVAPLRPRPAHFDPDWAVIRMLVVDPNARGLGLGKALVVACIARAVRDEARSIALHTSPMMTAALRLYRDLGFIVLRPAPMNFGAACSILVKPLAA